MMNDTIAPPERTLARLQLDPLRASDADPGQVYSMPLAPMAVEMGVIDKVLPWLDDAEDPLAMLEDCIDILDDANAFCGSRTCVAGM
jgi:hypothetical protein